MGHSVNVEIEKIKDFVKSCKRIRDFAGFNLCASRHMGQSYILAKKNDSLKAFCHLTIKLDCINPLERVMIFNTINEAMYGKEMAPELLEKELVCKADPL